MFLTIFLIVQGIYQHCICVFYTIVTVQFCTVLNVSLVRDAFHSYMSYISSCYPCSQGHRCFQDPAFNFTSFLKNVFVIYKFFIPVLRLIGGGEYFAWVIGPISRRMERRQIYCFIISSVAHFSLFQF